VEANPQTTKNWFRIPDWLRPNLTLPETGCMLALWTAQQMVSQAPVRNPFSASFILMGFAIIALSRNVAIVATTVTVLSIVLRIAFPISSWHDSHWLEWYSISSLATGHNIMLRSPLAGMSMASYLPQGDLFGGLFVALGMQKFWIPWHFIDALLFVVPVVVAPSFASLAVFFGLIWYWPFADYTTAGGNLEVQLAAVVAAVVCYRHGRKTTAVILFAFSALLRQPYITLIPFILILLWHERDYARMKLFTILLFLFGGIYILLDPKGAYTYEFGIWDAFQDGFFNYNHGLLGNYSISSIPQAFGVPDDVPWKQFKGIYMPLTAVGEMALLWIAWRSKKRDTVLFTALMAPVFVYILARGYAQYHYVVAAVLPFLAMVVPADQKKRIFDRYFTRGLGLTILWIGVSPLAIFAAGKIAATGDAVRGLAPVPVAHTRLLGADGTRTDVATPDGRDEHHQLCWLNQGLEFDFATPRFPSELRLSTDHIPIQNVKGVNIWWATETQMRGIITEGTIEYSTDGVNFGSRQPFRNELTYAAFPVTIQLPAATQPVRAVRLRAEHLYLDHTQWVIGNVEFFGR
jgi:hypothetical protein